jgi:hypothetical protein
MTAGQDPMIFHGGLNMLSGKHFEIEIHSFSSFTTFGEHLFAPDPLKSTQ